MLRPIITLTTDFGLSDHYVGVMKGVILRIAPQAEIVDITHDLAPYEINEAAFVMEQTYPYFPKKTIHVAVIDPGVGTTRRPILVEAAGQYFIAPDNGVLTPVLNREKHKARELSSVKYFLSPPSRTFHGRDIFAPCAAHLAMGASPASFGKLIQNHMRLFMPAPTRTSKRAWTGSVLRIDRFGNMITNYSTAEFSWIETHPFEMVVGMQQVRRLALNYSECPPGELFLIQGSSGYLEISASQCSAAKMVGCGVGAPLELTVW
jgi:S-adenosylmethionine hydrolase